MTVADRSGAVADQLVRTIPRWARLLGQELEGLAPSLSLRQFLVLQRIDEGARRTVDVARAVRVTSPTMTRVIDRLVQMGLVTRDLDPDDRRVLRLALTAAGRRLLQARRRALEARVREVLVDDGRATPAELDAVLLACQMLTRAMDARKGRVLGATSAPRVRRTGT
jgi:DNA-binding MarR family transcriptional regulator